MEQDIPEVSGGGIDAIRELITIGLGRSAAMLNDLTRSHITLEVPSVRIASFKNLSVEFDQAHQDEYATVNLSFKGAFSGTTALMIPEESAAWLVMALTGEVSDSPDLDLVRAETLTEVGNIIINGVMGSIGNVLEEPLSYSLPEYIDGGIRAIIHKTPWDPETPVIIAVTRFTIKDLSVTGEILIILEVGSLEVLVDRAMKIALGS